MANIDKTLTTELKQTLTNLGYEIIGVLFNNSQTLENYTNDNIALSEVDEIVVIGTELWERIKLPKKKRVDEKYIIDKINKEKIYKSFAPKFQKLLNNAFPEYNHTFNVYPTTYGIGVCVFFNREKSEMVDNIKELLDKHNIDYTNEYSDARHVYRFRLSKAKENVKRMETLC